MTTDQQTIAALQQENAHLREQVAALTAERNEASARYQWMEDLLEQSNIPICLWQGDDYVYTFANTAYLTGSGKHDALGKPIREVFTEHEIPGLMPVLERAYASGAVQTVQDALVRLNNPETGEEEERWFNLIYNPVRRAQGDVTGVSLFTIEVTDQIRARQKLHQQAQILEQVRGSVIVTDMQGNIVSWNQASTRIFGYAPEEVIGKPIASLYPPEDQEQLFSEIMTPLQEHGEMEMDATAYTRNGERFPIQLSLSLLRDDSGTPIGMIGYTIDITERLAAEAERAALQQQVIDAQREALRELSTPLIPITDTVMIMPLIGTVDSQRARMVMDTLLDGVAQHGAELAIIDITGVSVVDTQVAQAFIQAAQAVKLLGAQVMLTGIQPQIAQTLVHLETDLVGIITHGSLQAGIAAALDQ